MLSSYFILMFSAGTL